MVDTCHGTSAYSHAFIKRSMTVYFNQDSIIILPAVSKDSILLIGWGAIDKAYPTFRMGFKALYDSVGPYLLQKVHPDAAAGIDSRRYALVFTNYVDEQAVESHLQAITNLSYIWEKPQIPTRFVRMSSPLFSTCRIQAVYPNPATTTLNVVLNGLWTGSRPNLELLDLLGRSILSISPTYDENTLHLNVQEMSSGDYLLRFGKSTMHVLILKGD
jgi:hypothetical protein